MESEPKRPSSCDECKEPSCLRCKSGPDLIVLIGIPGIDDALLIENPKTRKLTRDESLE